MRVGNEYSPCLLACLPTLQKDQRRVISTMHLPNTVHPPCTHAPEDSDARHAPPSVHAPMHAMPPPSVHAPMHAMPPPSVHAPMHAMPPLQCTHPCTPCPPFSARTHARHAPPSVHTPMHAMPPPSVHAPMHAMPPPQGGLRGAAPCSPCPTLAACGRGGEPEAAAPGVCRGAAGGLPAPHTQLQEVEEGGGRGGSRGGRGVAGQGKCHVLAHLTAYLSGWERRGGGAGQGKACVSILTYLPMQCQH